jgi:hypothetical protein
VSDTASLERRAERLARWYPREWRDRYGDEFIQLLIDELAENRRSAYRNVNVMLHGMWSRLAYLGLVGTVRGPHLRMRARFMALAGVLVLFLMLAAGVWSQLTVGWQWSAPSNAPTRFGISIMSYALLGLGALIACFAVSLGVLVLMRGRHDGPRVWGLALVLCLAVGVLWVGSDHVAAHWPGTGGHAWSGRALVPASLARVVWAGTLWITSYWAHPSELRSFPASEVVWMLVSPLAWVTLIISVGAIVRQVKVSDTLARYLAVASAPALALMTVFLGGALMWVSSDQCGPRNLFAVGDIDIVILGTLAVGLTWATHLVRRVITGSFRPVTG